MGNKDTELSRQARLLEQREQRRAIITTASVAVTATLLVGGFALARVQSSEATTVEVGVKGVSSTSTQFQAPIVTTTAFVEPTTTTVRRVTTTAAPTTTTIPATTTTAVAIPPNLADLFTTTLPTTTTIAVAPNITWTANPNPLRLAGGAQGSYSVTAKNTGNGDGAVNCPTLPNGAVCTQQQITLAPGQSKSWSGMLWATTDGSRLGAELKPGTHTFWVGVTSISIVVP